MAEIGRYQSIQQDAGFENRSIGNFSHGVMRNIRSILAYDIVLTITRNIRIKKPSRLRIVKRRDGYVN